MQGNIILLDPLHWCCWESYLSGASYVGRPDSSGGEFGRATSPGPGASGVMWRARIRLRTVRTPYLIISNDLATRPPRILMSASISIPCSLTCGRLMNLNDKLVSVGGIAKLDRPDIIKGIGSWELHQKEWREVARMPYRYFQGFGEFDDVFARSRLDDLIYIQSYGATTLLALDMSRRQWR
ncbi:hypothetical protein M5K25_014285 [Dendrobium thyrsiflorum]|uniref:Uncharacterized protein n=1 Tax=Dendrobium thyrsiflorum TaxID=117978 RepID=A0ABD0UV99_DENTH